MATQPLSRTLESAVPGGHAIWSARSLPALAERPTVVAMAGPREHAAASRGSREPVRQVRQVRPQTLPPNHRATRPTVVVCGGASPERSYRTVGTTKPRSGVGAASPRLPLYRRSESASHIGAPSGLTPRGHVRLSDTGGGATEPAGDGRARSGMTVIQGLRLGPRSSETSPARYA
jgi:hypothetical protein